MLNSLMLNSFTDPANVYFLHITDLYHYTHKTVSSQQSTPKQTYSSCECTTSGIDVQLLLMTVVLEDCSLGG